MLGIEIKKSEVNFYQHFLMTSQIKKRFLLKVVIKLFLNLSYFVQISLNFLCNFMSKQFAKLSCAIKTNNVQTSKRLFWWLDRWYNLLWSGAKRRNKMEHDRICKRRSYKIIKKIPLKIQISLTNAIIFRLPRWTLICGCFIFFCTSP